MKLLVLLVCSLFFGSAFAQVSRSSSVTIYGKAATFMYIKIRNENLNFTECVRGPRSPYLGVVECVLDVYEAKEEVRGKVRISGLAANELYSMDTGAPEDSGIDCFVKRMRDGGHEVGCDLDAFIVESEGL